MRPALLALGVVLAGCGNAPDWPDEFSREYRAGCFRVLSERYIPEGELEYNFAALSEALAPLVDVCTLKIQTIHVLRVDSWSVQDGDAEGYFDPTAGITLGRSMRAWAHEMLHAKDAASLAVGSAWHEGWETNGYRERIDNYESRF